MSSRFAYTETAMQPAEFKEIRLGLGLSHGQMAAMLGYSSRIMAVRWELETISRRMIPPPIARLMRAFAAGYRPADWPLLRSADGSAEAKLDAAIAAFAEAGDKWAAGTLRGVRKRLHDPWRSAP
jgi:hypothetical protein